MFKDRIRPKAEVASSGKRPLNRHRGKIIQRFFVGTLYTPPFDARASFSKHLNYNDRLLTACFMLTNCSGHGSCVLMLTPAETGLDFSASLASRFNQLGQKLRQQGESK
jgi:hypothetical protein